jgi:FtsP/CotA-like multicopper oxidase with cupredoxin domain
VGGKLLEVNAPERHEDYSASPEEFFGCGEPAVWWNGNIKHDHQSAAAGGCLTRRTFAAGLASIPILRAQDRLSPTAADVTLRIERTTIEIAPGRAVTTTTYNGTAPGPLIRLKEGVPTSVEIVNHTDTLEYVHWHGFEVPPEVDGTEEEGSLPVPPGDHLQYQITPLQPGSRYVHSHAMAMGDLSLGTYSGQFAFVYVEPKRNPGSYDQEVFLSTHEWEPRLVSEDEESAEEGEDEAGQHSMEIQYGIRSINGKALGHGDPIRVKEGQRVLFHILNASATENITLHLPGHSFYVIALDGNQVPRPGRVTVLDLGVGERVDAIVEMNNPGVWIFGSVADAMRKNGLGIRLEYASRDGEPQYSATGGVAFDYLKFGRKQASPKPDEIIPMRITRVQAGEDGLERWAINGHVYSDRDDAKILQRGRRYRLAFNNRSAEAHPLHLHRYSFELVRIGSTPTAGIRKDVITLQPYQTAEVDFIPRQPGAALFHCHHQMHMEMGFKRLFRVL